MHETQALEPKTSTEAGPMSAKFGPPGRRNDHHFGSSLEQIGVYRMPVCWHILARAMTLATMPMRPSGGAEHIPERRFKQPPLRTRKLGDASCWQCAKLHNGEGLVACTSAAEAPKVVTFVPFPQLSKTPRPHTIPTEGSPVSWWAILGSHLYIRSACWATW